MLGAASRHEKKGADTLRANWLTRCVRCAHASPLVRRRPVAGLHRAVSGPVVAALNQNLCDTVTPMSCVVCSGFWKTRVPSENRQLCHVKSSNSRLSHT